MKLPLARATAALEDIAACLKAICRSNGIEITPPVQQRRVRPVGLEGLVDLDEDEAAALNKELDEQGYGDEEEDETEAEGGTTVIGRVLRR